LSESLCLVVCIKISQLALTIISEAKKYEKINLHKFPVYLLLPRISIMKVRRLPGSSNTFIYHCQMSINESKNTSWEFQHIYIIVKCRFWYLIYNWLTMISYSHLQHAYNLGGLVLLIRLALVWLHNYPMVIYLYL
jgi:hypothetical protein